MKHDLSLFTEDMVEDLAALEESVDIHNAIQKLDGEILTSDANACAVEATAKVLRDIVIKQQSEKAEHLKRLSLVKSKLARRLPHAFRTI